MFFLNDHAKLAQLTALLVKRASALELELWASYFHDILQHKPNFTALDKKFIEKYQANAELHALCQKREHFDWPSLISFMVSEDPISSEINHSGQLLFYYQFNKHAEKIKSKIQASDFTTARKLAEATFAAEMEVPGVDPTYDADGHVSIKIGRTGCRARGFILGDLFWGLIGIVSSIVVLVASILLSPIFCCAGSQYFGTLSFAFDAAKWFVDSIRQLTFSILFPLGMLYAKYTTDSYDTTKGEVTRILESIIACCERIEARPPQQAYAAPNQALLTFQASPQ